MSQVPVAGTVEQLRGLTRSWRRNGETVAVVPTMGALHDGHLELVRQARSHGGRVVVSIFVNPAQFAPNEDLDKYPRTFAEDLRLLTGAAADLVWAPGPKEMYPDAFATRILPTGAAEGLETDQRPHFFGGVATVCCKLFNQTQADIAMFGEKDYQQLCVIRQLVRDLDLPIEIVGVPTVREADGLAMSSRNRYLTAADRRIAPALHAIISDVAQAAAGLDHGEAATMAASSRLLSAGFRKVDYVVIRDAVTLRPATSATCIRRVLVAAWLGETRLIDNVPVPG